MIPAKATVLANVHYSNSVLVLAKITSLVVAKITSIKIKYW